MSTKKLLLAATILTPVLFALAQPARAQTAPLPEQGQQTQKTPDQIQAEKDAKEIEKMIEKGEVDPDDLLGGKPAQPPVLVEADKDEWQSSGDDLPPIGSKHAWTEIKVENRECYLYVHTTVTTPDGKFFHHIDKIRQPCPLDRIVTHADGSTTEYYRDGSALIKDKTGKLIGALGAPVTAPQTPEPEKKKAEITPKPEPKTTRKPEPKPEHKSTSMKPKVKETTAVAARTPTRTVRPAQPEIDNAQVAETLATIATVAISAYGAHSAMRAERMHGMRDDRMMMKHGGGGMMERGGMGHGMRQGPMGSGGPLGGMFR